MKDVDPSEYRKNAIIMQRIENVRKLRGASNRDGTRKLADVPMLFGEIRQPDKDYIIVPRVSSENRRYIPIGFMPPSVIASDATLIIPSATLYHFGVLTSNVHMAWTRVVCGRLKSDYRYSKDIVYNNFPWASPTEGQKAQIEKTAQAILDARAKFPDSSLADLYGDTMYLYPTLMEAHRANDRAVMAAYGFQIKMSETECVAELMKLYQEKVTGH